MAKGNIHKKLTFKEKFDLNYDCWIKNNRKAQRFQKKRNRKQFRKLQKEELKKELSEEES